VYNCVYYCDINTYRYVGLLVGVGEAARRGVCGGEGYVWGCVGACVGVRGGRRGRGVKG
jgi:hypothetical protein